MQAIIMVGGKQQQVTPGEVIRVERLNGNTGETVEFQRVLAIKDKNIKLGNPFINEAKVSGEILKHGRADKIRVLRYKRKKQYRKTTGHRQAYTEVKINEIMA